MTWLRHLSLVGCEARCPSYWEPARVGEVPWSLSYSSMIVATLSRRMARVRPRMVEGEHCNCFLRVAIVAMLTQTAVQRGVNKLLRSTKHRHGGHCSSSSSKNGCIGTGEGPTAIFIRARSAPPPHDGEARERKLNYTETICFVLYNRVQRNSI